MTRFVVVILGFLLLLPEIGLAAGVNRVWSCAYNDCSSLVAQTGDNLDAGNADTTTACAVGTARPVNCQIGECFFDTDETAGQNLYGCTTSGAWTLLGDGTGSNAFTDITTGTNTTATMTVGSGASMTTSGSGTIAATDLACTTCVSDGELALQYALLAGRAGGQTLNGGDAASNTLVLDSTSHATKGEIRLLDRVALWDEDFTSTAAFALMNWDKTITLNSTVAWPDILSVTGIFQFDQPPLLGNPPKLFRFQGNLELNISGTHVLNGVTPFYSQPKIKTTLGTWDLLDEDTSLASFIDVTIFDGTFTATSAYTQFKARGEVKSGTTIGELNGFKCTDPAVAGTLTTRRCLVIDPHTNAGTSIGIENNSTTVNPPGTVLDPTTTITATRTVHELRPTANRILPNPAIADGEDGQVVTFINSSLIYWVRFWDGRNIRVSDQQCKGMCQNNLTYGDYCTLSLWDSMTFTYLDSLGEWVMTACADNN